jgi:GH43 family beta-xylosidase
MKSKGQIESKKHEARLAKKLGGQRNAGSGAFWSRKGDVRASDVLIEHKYTGKASITVKAAVLEKIVKEAIFESRMPALGISLNDTNYILLTEDDFLELRQMFQEHKTCTKKTSDTMKVGDTTLNAEG